MDGSEEADLPKVLIQGKQSGGLHNEKSTAMDSLGGAVCFLILVGTAAAMAQSGGRRARAEGLKTITDKFFAALEAHKPSSRRSRPERDTRKTGWKLPLEKAPGKRPAS
jgi:hypothetical protein